MNYLNNNRWLLRTVGRMHRNLINAKIEEKGIGDVSNPLILISLKENFENMTASQKEIAEFIGVKAPTVALSVKRMVNSGLLAKVINPEDMRSNKISLTEKGLEHIENCKEVIDEIDRELFKGFSEEEIFQLGYMFMHMISNLESMGAQVPKHLEMKIANNKYENNYVN